jgi:hypothetical protein
MENVAETNKEGHVHHQKETTSKFSQALFISPPSFYLTFISKMDDTFEGAVGIDLGTTYS